MSSAVHHIIFLIFFSLLTWPSTWPLLIVLITVWFTASKSFCIPLAKFRSSDVVFTALKSQSCNVPSAIFTNRFLNSLANSAVALIFGAFLKRISRKFRSFRFSWSQFAPEYPQIEYISSRFQRKGPQRGQINHIIRNRLIINRHRKK